MQAHDARGDRLVDNLLGFGRALRRAGVPVDSARIALASQAARVVGLPARDDLKAALEAVMVSRQRDLAVFRELFDLYFRVPDDSLTLAAATLTAAAPPHRPRLDEALAPRRPFSPPAPDPAADDDRRDAALTATDLQVLRQADFGALGAHEYALVERLARAIALPIPRTASRRTRVAWRGARLHWAGALRRASQTGGELMQLPRLARREEPLPLLVLVDVSGSMERYARLLLAFLHASTRDLRGRRDVFAFGTHLTDLTPAFRLADTDAMLAAASAAIDDFAGGTRLGESLATLRAQHARRLVGRRTVVLVISDGLDTGEPEALARELHWLRLKTRRVLWLNPLLRFASYQPLARGAAVLHRHAHAMLPVHNLGELGHLAAGLATLLKN